MTQKSLLARDAAEIDKNFKTKRKLIKNGIEYATTFFLLLLCVHSALATTVEIEPTSAIRNAGESLNITCRVGYAIDSCRFIIGKDSYRLNPRQQDGDIRYYGDGLDSGTCGVIINRVNEQMNGQISCVVPPDTGNIEATAGMKLIIAKEPTDINMITNHNGPYTEGDVFSGECIARNGRPGADISWTINNEPVDENAVITVEPPDKSINDYGSVIKNYSLALTPDEDGKIVSCVINHYTFVNPKVFSQQLIVHYPPQKADSDIITLFGFHLGKEGLLTVMIRSNPAPEVSWRIDNEMITDTVLSDGKYNALEPIPMGNGFYNCTLMIASVEKTDVEHDFYVKASNSYGVKVFHVRITTMDEPPGIHLSAGAILGIVIGLILAIVAIVLLIFAASTSRWCFAKGQRRDNAKGSGESTPAAGDVLLESGVPSLQTGPDTESAVGGRSTRWKFSELRDRVRSVLPKHKDKVQAADQPDNVDEEKATTEEKKGVVYAELALGEQQAAKPPAANTEYAEIVYSYQPENETNKPPETNKPQI